MKEEKLQKYFKGMLVKKSNVQELFASMSIPSFIRDWFINRYSNQTSEININFLKAKINELMLRNVSFESVVDKLINGEKIKLLGKININIDVKTNVVSFSLPDYPLDSSATIISKDVWCKIKDQLLTTDGDNWGIITLGYRSFQEGKSKVNKVSVEDYKAFVPYNVDLTYYKEARSYFTTEEWIDVILEAIDYNSKGYESLEAKLMVLTRLLPFVEKRLNLIELAPKGTGKSYLFSQISKYSWLSTGGVMTRAKLFYDMKLKQEGLIANYDFVALDEISTIKFPDENEIQGALKGYMENGKYTVGVKASSATSGVVILGNIDYDLMNVEVPMFDNLPNIFKDSALIDRFHGFIEGWKIPRMRENLKMNGLAINTEYFSTILHNLREDVEASAIVDKYIGYNSDSDTRDVTAVKRITTAFIKLLFPHWSISKGNVNLEELEKYCLNRAINMRSIIKKQLVLMDVEYSHTPKPDFYVKNNNIN